jgi:cytochrome c biogenesis protein CcmG, thiol:disulfide interchange protein DsbE
MSQRKAKQARRAEQAAHPAPRRPSRGRQRLWIYAAVVAVAVAVAGGVLAARGNGPAQTISVGSGGGSVLNLSGTDPITGRHVSLAAFRGKPIVLNFWASWCTGCRQEARDLAAFERRHPEAQVVGVDTQDTDGNARAFYRELGLSHPSIRDRSGAIAARLGLQGLPTTFFLDRRHRLVTRIIGASNLAGFEAGLRAALHSA